MGTMLLGFTIKSCGVGFSKEKAKKLISFSLPLILTGIISFYITFGDRYFLRVYGGLDEVGIYSLAYKFGFLLTFLIVNPFNAIWDSEKYNIVKEDGNVKKFNKIFTHYITLIIIVCIGLTLFVKDVLHVMAAPEFWGAAKIVPIILAAYVTNALSAYVNLGILLRNRTIEITYGTVVASFVITAGYLVLIPCMVQWERHWQQCSLLVLDLFGFILGQSVCLIWSYHGGRYGR
jgi:O-antigen/teichoic acid export membrane protein